ncbi:MAG: hypothetical protein R3261_13800, partial [Alphaproteobacteria bacterium]|nr:hypothetical protein [Alphaproteobacteria bacterium]
MATIRKVVSKTTGKTSYQVQIRKKGLPPINRTFAKKTEAKHWADLKEQELHHAKNFGGNLVQTSNLHDLIERYIKDILPHKSAETYRTQLIQLQWWQKHYGKADIKELT